MSILNTTRPRNGFTIVELLIVIVVIGILAAVVIVAYNGVQKNATGAVMKETVQSAGTKMKLANASTETYPATLPQDLKTPAGIGLALATVSSANEFCINVTAPKYTDLQWNVNQTGVLKTGLCSGAVITASIIGDYSATSAPVTSVKTFNGTSLSVNGTEANFKITTDEAWTQQTFSWDALPNTTQYEIQTRDPGGTWYNRRLTDGANAYAPPSSGGTSGSIATNSASIVWTSTNSRPTTAGQSHEYRFRAYVGGVASAWSDATVTVPTTDIMPAVPTFTVVPNMPWSNVTVAWTAPAGFGSPSNVFYDVQTRDPSGTWVNRRLTDGGNSYTPPSSGGTSGGIALSTLTYTWDSPTIIPSTAGQSHEYRVRLRSATTNAIYGPWNTVVLTAPTSATLPAMSAFNVTQNGSWSGITISWTGPSGFGTPSGIVYELLTRISGGTWYARALSSGSGSYAPPSSGGTSGSIELTATPSLSWSSSVAMPAAGQTHEYQMRVKSGTTTAVYGPWSTASLTR